MYVNKFKIHEQIIWFVQ